MFAGRYFAAFLFDMDGTLLNSTAAAERVWSAWAIRHGLDVAAFLPTMHGRRAIETVRRLALPGIDAQREADEISQAEIADVEGIHAIAGAAVVVVPAAHLHKMETPHATIFDYRGLRAVADVQGKLGLERTQSLSAS